MLQFNTLNARAIYSFPNAEQKSPSLHFGRDPKPEFTQAPGDSFIPNNKNSLKERCLAFETALKKIPEIKPYDDYFKINLHKAYTIFLSTRMKRAFIKIEPSDIEVLQKKAIAISKAGDTLFEFYTMIALRDGLITNSDIDRWKNQLPKWKAKKISQTTLVKNLLQEIEKTPEKAKKLAKFQTMVLNGDDQNRVKWLLGLVALHFTILASEDKTNRFDLNHSDQVKLMLARRSKELRDHLSFLSIPHIKSYLLDLFYVRTPLFSSILPKDIFRNQIVKLSQNYLEAPVEYHQFIKLAYDSQWSTRELDFTCEKQLPRLEQRIGIVKCVDTLETVSILKQAYEAKKACKR